MNRWLKTFNIKCASNGKQRIVAKEWSGDDLIVENGPFRFEKKESKGNFEVRLAPWAYIDDLNSNIQCLLNNLERYDMHTVH